MVGRALVVLFVLKFVSWAIALGSGTSGGTLAPLFTIGGGLGAVLGRGAVHLLPGLGIDPRVAALVGMAAMFAGASRALLASVVFAFETTRQPLSLLPLLGGCTAAYLISALMMRHTIMTEKIARRGARVLAEYTADYLDQVLVRDAATRQVVALAADDTLASVRAWFSSRGAGTGHQGFPVHDRNGNLVGVLTRRDIFNTDGARDQPALAADQASAGDRLRGQLPARGRRPHGRARTWAGCRWWRATNPRRVIGLADAQRSALRPPPTAGRRVP